MIFYCKIIKIFSRDYRCESTGVWNEMFAIPMRFVRRITATLLGPKYQAPILAFSDSPLWFLCPSERTAARVKAVNVLVLLIRFPLLYEERGKSQRRFKLLSSVRSNVRRVPAYGSNFLMKSNPDPSGRQSFSDRAVVAMADPFPEWKVGVYKFRQRRC
jgi:hypothetical protein